MTTYNFDRRIDRRSNYAIKWTMFPEDVIPMWVADMDFATADEILQAMRDRIDEGTFGYAFDHPPLRETLSARMKNLYNWDVAPDEILLPPGLVYGLALVGGVVGKPGDGVVMTTPVYGPFLMIPPNVNRFAYTVDMFYVQDDARSFHYEIDFDAFEKAASQKQVSLFYLCNPHNPGGHIHTRAELERLAEICLRHDVIICSDEIHCDLLFDGNKHLPIAALSPEISKRTITMIAPSKTFNLAGLASSAFIVQDEDLRKKLGAAMWGMGVHGNIMGLYAAYAAYSKGEDWLKQALAYMQTNRDTAIDFIHENMPAIKYMRPEATHLLWLDTRELGVEGPPAEFFLKEAKVALNDGTFFGPIGKDFVRLNFATPRDLMLEGLERMRVALSNGHHTAPT